MNDIDGWMSEAELEWLANMAKRSSSILEIGIWKGRSTSEICNNTAGKVIAIDNWKGDPDNQVDFKELEVVDIEGIAIENLGPYLKNRKLRIIKQDSRVAWKKIRRTFDWIFIDGSHGYNIVASDIITYRRFLTPNGTISGHDIQLDTVRAAVRDTLGVYSIQNGTNIWFKVI